MIHPSRADGQRRVDLFLAAGVHPGGGLSHVKAKHLVQRALHLPHEPAEQQEEDEHVQRGSAVAAAVLSSHGS